MKYIVEYSAGVREIREDIPDNPFVVASAPLPDDYREGDQYEIQNGVAVKVEAVGEEIETGEELETRTTESLIRDVINQI